MKIFATDMNVKWFHARSKMSTLLISEDEFDDEWGKLNCLTMHHHLQPLDLEDHSQKFPEDALESEWFLTVRQYLLKTCHKVNWNHHAMGL